jgi:hypothetical protein
MDRRVFQPRPDNSAERRRNALGMAIVILAAGGLWLYYRQQPVSVVRPVSAKSIPAQPAR